MSIPKHMITTGCELPGYQITENLGIVKGISSRGRGFGEFWVGTHAETFDKAMDEAIALMLNKVEHLGAQAVIGVGYDLTVDHRAWYACQVVAYGTAVKVVKK